MATFRKFEDIEAWQLARVLTQKVYALSAEGAFGKDFELRNQMRRAVISVMSNIAEGYERDGRREFIQFLSIAKASIGELRSQCYVALDAGYINQAQFDDWLTDAVKISGKLSGLMSYLRQSEIRGSKFSTTKP